MNNNYITESSMEDSFIFQTFNSNNDLTEKLVKALKIGTNLDSSFIEEQHLQIKKSLFSPLARNVLDAYDKGLIRINYCGTVKIPTAIPFIVHKTGNGDIVSTIFISSFGKITETNTLDIPVRNLYVLMEAAYLALNYSIYPVKLQKSYALLKITNNVYTSMLIRIFNKEFSLSLDKTLYDKVTFVISKFFITKVWGVTNPDIVTTYASSVSLNPDINDITEINSAYDKADIKTINDLLLFIKSLSPRFTELNVRYFVEKYLNTYYGSSIMAMDYLPYALFVIISVLLGSFMVSQNALSDIIKNTKGINTFYSELSKLF